MHNLNRLQKVGIHCPEVVSLRKHVLVMSFIGNDQKAAPKLKGRISIQTLPFFIFGFRIGVSLFPSLHLCPPLIPSIYLFIHSFIFLLLSFPFLLTIPYPVPFVPPPLSENPFPHHHRRPLVLVPNGVCPRPDDRHDEDDVQVCPNHSR